MQKQINQSLKSKNIIAVSLQIVAFSGKKINPFKKK